MSPQELSLVGREVCKDVGISFLSCAGGKYRAVSPELGQDKRALPGRVNTVETR